MMMIKILFVFWRGGKIQKLIVTMLWDYVYSECAYIFDKNDKVYFKV